MFRSLIAAFSMYSSIPMPKTEWTPETLKYSLCFFPMVGAVIGACSLGVFHGFERLFVGEASRAAVLTVLPVLINGGIHMDGYLDTVDAKSSYGTAQEKLRILKDPHTGAFAVIHAAVYFFLCYALFCSASGCAMILVGMGYMYSRILSGISVIFFPKAKKEGMAAESAKAANLGQRRAGWILAVQWAAWTCFLFCIPGVKRQAAVGVFLAGVGAFFYYYRMAMRLFGGITGDLAGYFLQLCELAILFAAVVLS